MGGATLTIESIKVQEKKDAGTINITGQLGEVMTESVQIAYSYVKSVAKNYGVDENYFNDAIIHLHIPEGTRRCYSKRRTFCRYYFSYCFIIACYE